mmetsp:Transcript_66283/g.191324  ORF Transcript_66283/g.191324 Transcript_66283/m.191324 type:complete len:256 (-) Transcript_66283:123-890(-)
MDQPRVRIPRATNAAPVPSQGQVLHMVAGLKRRRRVVHCERRRRILDFRQDHHFVARVAGPDRSQATAAGVLHGMSYLAPDLLKLLCIEKVRQDVVPVVMCRNEDRDVDDGVLRQLAFLRCLDLLDHNAEAARRPACLNMVRRRHPSLHVPGEDAVQRGKQYILDVRHFVERFLRNANEKDVRIHHMHRVPNLHALPAGELFYERLDARKVAPGPSGIVLQQGCAKGLFDAVHRAELLCAHERHPPVRRHARHAA